MNIYLKVILFCFVLSFAFVLDLHAVKVPKIDICHFNSDTGLYEKLNVSMNGWLNGHQPQHPMDGLPGEGNLDENCVVIPPPFVFARVYREMFPTLGGDPNQYDADKDILYVEVVDTNRNNQLGAGDEIHVDSLPIDCVGGTISVNVGTHVITAAPIVQTDQLSLDTADGSFVIRNKVNVNAQVNQQYIETHNTDVTSIVNNSGAVSTLLSFTIDPLSPSQPQQINSSSNQCDQNSGYDPNMLQVRIYQP
jgi:hypothetical protein